MNVFLTIILLSMQLKLEISHAFSPNPMHKRHPVTCMQPSSSTRSTSLYSTSSTRTSLSSTSADDPSFDFQKLQELSPEYVNMRKHPEEDLLIFNYTPKTQYNRKWTPETLSARGLITDLEGNIVARPFPKFFNLREHEGPLPDGPFEVYEKMDGSLGIIYFVNGGEPRVATRGNFDSKQAEYAMKMLREKYSHVQFNPTITYLVEIIYPKKQMVVDYGDTEALILLGMIETASGKELPLEDIGIPVVKKYDGLSSSDIHSLSAINERNKEGFVVRYSNGLRLKVKFGDYIFQQKYLPRIWKHLSTNNDNIDKILEGIPDELHDEVKKSVKKLQ